MNDGKVSNDFFNDTMYRESPDSTDSISTVPGLVRIANSTILPKFPDIVRFYFAQIPLFM